MFTEEQTALLERRSRQLLEVGRVLADSPRWSPLCENLDGMERSVTALLLQNQLDFIHDNRPEIQIMSEGLNQLMAEKGIVETTKIVNIGNLRVLAA